MTVIERLQSPLPPARPNRRDPFALLRHNFLLKMISLTAAILLHLFVQAERNPSLTRGLVAQIVIEHLPPNTDVKNEAQIMVNVTGPRAIVEHLKDSDIHAIADLSGIKSNNDEGQMVRVHFTAQNVPPGTALIYEPPSRAVKMQIFQPETRQMLVEANFPQEPAAGYRLQQAGSAPQSRQSAWNARRGAESGQPDRHCDAGRTRWNHRRDVPGACPR